MEGRFKTQTGFCHVLPEYIILTPFKFIQYSSVRLKKDKRHLFLASYIFFILLLGYFTFHRYVREEWLQVFVIGGFVLLLILKTFELIKIVTAKIIDKNAIKEINFFPAENKNSITWYKIYFKKNEQIKSSFFTLPNSTAGSTLETESSARIMINNGFLKTNKRTSILLDYLGRMHPNEKEVALEYALGNNDGPSFFAKLDENEVLVWCFENGLVITKSINLDGLLESMIIRWDEVEVTYYTKSRDDHFDRTHGSVSSLWSWSLSIRLFNKQNIIISENVPSGWLIHRDYIRYWSQMERILQARRETATLDKITQIDTISHYISEAQCKRYLEQINNNKVIHFGILSVKKDGFMMDDKEIIPWSQLKEIDVSLDYERRNKLARKLNPVPNHEKKRFYMNIVLNQGNGPVVHDLPAESIPNWGGFCSLCKVLQDRALNK